MPLNMKPFILGAGLAGLTTAIALAPMPVVLVSPRALGTGCASAWAQGGIAAALGADDSPDLHISDTLAAGAGLNDAAIVKQTLYDARRVIEKLIASGTDFDRDAQGTLRLGLEAAHQKRRIVHATDATGRVVMQALIKIARTTPSIEILENTLADSLSLDAEGIAGVWLRQSDQVIHRATRRVVLATGGAAALWRNTTNPHENWGKGLALAARAGATLGDLEFIQFHPTAIDVGRDPMPLASEALRGEGAILITEKDERFINELAPRDVVARAIWQQITLGHRVFLDATQAIGDSFATRFPTIHDLCTSASIDPSRMPIPVRPAAHYHMGGVVTDARGCTDMAGLWACGEVACTGLHGANRLASNSLLEAASFGQRVAEDIAGLSPTLLPAPSPPALPPATETSAEQAAQIRARMSDAVGVTRNRAGLQRAIDFLSPLAAASDMALVGRLIALSALQREESRGAHTRTDFPATLATAQVSRIRLDNQGE